MTRLVVFDLETTGIDVYSDRIVTAYLAILAADGSIEIQRDWLVDPGIEIPEGAAAVHGITTEHARAHGRKDVAEVLREMLAILEVECRRNGLPLAGYNLSYDLTLLDAEIKRHVHPDAGLNLDGITVLDGLVIDKAVDRFRRGSRKLIDTARHYGVPITEEEAHAASFDAVAAGRIVQTILASTKLGRHTPEQLHRMQIGWRREQAESLQAYLRSPKNKDGANPHAYVNPGWPIQTPEPAVIHPAAHPEGVAA